MSQIRDHRTRALSYGGHECVTIVRKGLNIAYFYNPKFVNNMHVGLDHSIFLHDCKHVYIVGHTVEKCISHMYIDYTMTWRAVQGFHNRGTKARG